MSRNQVIAAVATVVTVLVGLYVLRGTVAWSDRGCDLPSSVVHTVLRGEPGTFEYCELPASATTTTTTLSLGDWREPPATTTTVDPEVLAEQERVEAERQAEAERRQAEIDACWATYDAAWGAWYDAYGAWLTDTGGQGDYDAWLVGHPQPAEPGCES